MEENINKNKNIFYSIWIKIFLLIISEISALMLPVASIGLFIHEYLRKRGNGSYGVIVSKLTDMKWFYSEKSAYNFVKMILDFRLFFFIVGLILWIVTFFLLMHLAGRNGKKELSLAVLDKIPLLLLIILWSVICTLPFIVILQFIDLIGVFQMSIEMVMIISIIAFTCIYIPTAIFVMSIASRIKSKRFLETTLIGLIINKINEVKKTIDEFDEKVPGKVNSVKFKMKRIIEYEALFCVILLITGNVVLIPIVILIIIFTFTKVLDFLKQRQDISDGIRRIAEGDFSQNIDIVNMNKYLIYDAKNVNKINNSVEMAINEKMKSERMKTALITNVSHDIKTPLTSIINYVNLLDEEIKNNTESESDVKIKEYLDVLNRQSIRLKKLIEDLIEASKASSGNIDVHMEKVDVKVLLNQAVAEFSDRMKNADLDLVIEDKENAYIKADGRLLWRVYANLLSNICKYSLPSSRIYINMKKEADNLRVEFKNVSKDQLNVNPSELMERFVRGDSSRNTEGSGLGLSIANSLTLAMGGDMKLSIDGDLFKAILTFKMVENN